MPQFSSFPLIVQHVVLCVVLLSDDWELDCILFRTSDLRDVDRQTTRHR